MRQVMKTGKISRRMKRILAMPLGCCEDSYCFLIRRCVLSSDLFFQFQDAAHALVDALFGERTVFDGFDHSIEGALNAAAEEGRR